MQNNVVVTLHARDAGVLDGAHLVPVVVGEECLKWQMSLFPGGVFSVYEKYCFATVNRLCL